MSEAVLIKEGVRRLERRCTSSIAQRTQMRSSGVCCVAEDAEVSFGVGRRWEMVE